MMYAEFTEVITGGIRQGTERKVVVNLDKVVSFRAASTNSTGAVLETRRGDIQVKETYDQIKEVFNSKNGVPPALIPVTNPVRPQVS